VLEKVYPLGLAFSTTFAIWNPRPRLFRARHREWQLYVDTGRPRRKQALLVQMVVREKL